MSQTQNSQRMKLALAGVAAAAIAVGGGVAWWGSQSPVELVPTEQRIEQPGAVDQPGAQDTTGADPESVSPDSATDSPSASASGGSGPGSAVGGDSAAGTPVYWVGGDGNSIEYDAQRIAVNPSASASDKLRTAMTELLAGGEATAIPTGTELLSAEIKGKDVYVDFSGDFTAGGGSSAMAARLGQVIYTANAIEPEAQVWISVDGEPLTQLGGEGLLVNQPLTVAIFERDFNF